MPYGNHVKHSTPKFASHKRGRYVVDSSGMLTGQDDTHVDLHAFLTKHSLHVDVMPIYTNVMRASGLLQSGFALVERPGKVKNGSIVVVSYNGDTIMRKLIKRDRAWYLTADDPREKELKITENCDVARIGVVIASVFRFEK